MTDLRQATAEPSYVGDDVGYGLEPVELRGRRDPAYLFLAVIKERVDEVDNPLEERVAS